MLTDRQVVSIRRAFGINSSVNVKLSKTQLFKIIQSGKLMRVGLSLMKNVLTLWAKIVLVPLGLTAVASVADARIHKNIRIKNKNRNNIR